MKKRLFFIFIFFIGLLMLSACQSNDLGEFDDDPQNDPDVITLGSNVPLRKIIYTVDLTLYTKDLEASITTLKGLIQSDEWFDFEQIRETQAIFVIRVKSERIDLFTENLKDEFTVSYFSKLGKDISLDYQNTTNRIAALEAQHERLLLLYADASLSEMLTINQRISEIETQLLALEGTLNNFDSLVDYSEVNITIYESRITSRAPFFNRLFAAFSSGISGVISFFDGLFIVLATLIPFAIVFVPSGYGIHILIKKIKHRRALKQSKPKL